jgi:hypothetical protein
LTEEEVEFILRVVDYLEFGSGMKDWRKIEAIEELAVQLVPHLYRNDEAIERIKIEMQ